MDKRKSWALIAAFGLALAGCANTAADGENPGHVYHVYFLGGQSNMEGAGFADDLPAEYRAAREDVRIFHGRTREDGQEGGGVGLWAPVQPGHGFGFDTDGSANTRRGRFGPEIAFAHAMADGEPDRRIAIVKYVRGGSALVDGISEWGSWDPGYTDGNARNQYDNALTTIANAMQQSDVDGDGHADTLVPAGIVWMQGESDAAADIGSAENYAQNLARMMALLRAALHDDDLPVVIGRIRDSGDTPETRIMAHSPIVREQQARFVEDDRCAALVTASDAFTFPPDDRWHYVSEDYLTLGTAFAEAMITLEDNCG